MKSTRRLAKQFSQILHEQFEQFLETLTVSPMEGVAVHDARKRIKKIRAIVHLFRASLGDEGRRIDRLLRSAGHQLAASRDRDAALETIDSVHRHFASIVTTRTVASVKRGVVLNAPTSHIDTQQSHCALKHVAAKLSNHIRRRASRSALRKGVIGGYDRARAALRQILVEPEDAGFHRWRRRVKDHWYQLRVLEAITPSLVTRIRSLKRLETLLGDEHNLVVLRHMLLQHPERFGDPRHLALVLGCVDRRGATLRERAVHAGRQLFHSTAREFYRSTHS